MTAPARAYATADTDENKAQARRIAAILLCGVVLLLTMGAPVPWPQQVCVSLFAVLLLIVANLRAGSRWMTLALLAASCAMTARYALWRVVTVSRFVRAGVGLHGAVSAIFPVLLLAAEGYGFLNLWLGYFQMAWPLRRPPQPLPAEPAQWPDVDVLISTLHEPLQVLESTALAALNMDWPPAKLRIWVLDEGRRAPVRRFCAAAGVEYLEHRGDRESTKAASLNAAMARTTSPFVLILDAGHVPVRSMLQFVMGGLVRDAGLALLQTPLNESSADLFERNLNQQTAVPRKDDLFYRVVQAGNDLWNAVCFCGTGAVLRRTALEQIGGFPREGVTWDVQTSLHLQRAGWRTAYLNLPLTAGLMTEGLSSFFQRKRRRARGVARMLRLEKPVFARGLTQPQQLCLLQEYLSPFGAIPRLIFLFAPLVYLGFEGTTLPATWLAVLTYAVPHLTFAYTVKARLERPHRWPFWEGIYEAVVAPFVLLPTVQGLLSPHRRHSAHAGKIRPLKRASFNVRAAWPLVLLFCANAFGLIRIAVRAGGVSAGQSRGAIWLHAAWAALNLMILSVAVSVSREAPQRRRAVRLRRSLPVTVLLQGGRRIEGRTENLSMGGVQMRGERAGEAHTTEAASVLLMVHGREVILPATVVANFPGGLRLEFDSLTWQQHESLATLLFSAADSWADRRPAMTGDLLTSLATVARLAALGPLRVLRSLRQSPAPVRGAVLLLLLLAAGLCGRWAFAVQARADDRQSDHSRLPRSAIVLPGKGMAATSGPDKTASVTQWVNLGALNRSQSSRLPDDVANQRWIFTVARNQVIDRARLFLRYRLSDPNHSRVELRISLNGVDLGTQEDGSGQAPMVGGMREGQGMWHEWQVLLPSELLVRENDLQFKPGERKPCAGSGCSGSGLEVDLARSGLQLRVSSFAIPEHGVPRTELLPPQPTRRKLRWPEALAAVPGGGTALTRVALATVLCAALATLLARYLQERARQRLCVVE